MTITKPALRELAAGAIGARHVGYRPALAAVAEMQRAVTPEILIDLIDGQARVSAVEGVIAKWERVFGRENALLLELRKAIEGGA